MSCLCAYQKADNDEPDQMISHGRRTKTNLSRWMTDLNPELKKVPLYHLVLPGSHNSFTYSLTRSSEVGPDADQWLQDLAKRLGFVAKPIIYNWSVCQGLSCAQQLAIGVRYFDFRLGKELKKKKRTEKYLATSEIHLLHGLFGLRVEEALKEVRTFLDANPGEVVILDFQHLYGFDETDRQYVTNLILDTFKSKLCPVTPDVNIDYMISRGYQVIAVNRIEVKNEEEEFFWPRSACPNPWANTTSVQKLGNFLDEGLQARAKSQSRCFFVSQGILTPDADTVVLHLLSTLKATLAKKCNKFISDQWLPKLQSGNLPANIILLDFVSESTARTIVDLNLSKLRQ